MNFSNLDQLINMQETRIIPHRPQICSDSSSEAAHPLADLIGDFNRGGTSSSQTSREFPITGSNSMPSRDGDTVILGTVSEPLPS